MFCEHDIESESETTKSDTESDSESDDSVIVRVANVGASSDSSPELENLQLALLPELENLQLALLDVVHPFASEKHKGDEAFSPPELTATLANILRIGLLSEKQVGVVLTLLCRREY